MGKVNKARFDELETQGKSDARAMGGGGTAGAVRCSVCESTKKGKCGTETGTASWAFPNPGLPVCPYSSCEGTSYLCRLSARSYVIHITKDVNHFSFTKSAPRSCHNLPTAIAAEMDKIKGGVDEGGVPVGMQRATWEQCVEVCEAVIDEFSGSLNENALVSLKRPNLYKRLASGWQRATKCGKERSALSGALEELIDPDDMAIVGSDDKLPAEKQNVDLPIVQRGALPAWWTSDADAALLVYVLRVSPNPGRLFCRLSRVITHTHYERLTFSFTIAEGRFGSGFRRGARRRLTRSSKRSAWTRV